MSPGDRVIRGKTIDYLNGSSEWKIEHFFKGNIKEIQLWMDDLTANEKAVLFTISPYVGYDDCCLKKLNGDMLRFDDIVRMSGLSRSTVSEVLNSLQKKDILCKNTNSRERQYFVNPWLFCRGSRVNKVLQTMFRNYGVRVYGGTKWKNLKD
jgi:DNA-binding MarR family transcriptional regulator